MPQLNPAELLAIHEMATTLATDINKLTAYLSFVDDPHLEAMLRHARQKAETHYHELIDLANGESLNRRFEGLDGGLSGRPKGMPSQSPTPVRPRVESGFSARTIASDCLSCNKNMAVRALWFATEASHVGLRRAFSEMSRYYLDAAYEFYKFMEQQGWYVPLEAQDNPSDWFRRNHEQMTAFIQTEGDWNRSPGMPS